MPDEKIETHFSTLEIQLILSCVATKTDEEIAELLEVAVEAITEKIREMTGEDPGERKKGIEHERLTQAQEASRKRHVAAETKARTKRPKDLEEEWLAAKQELRRRDHARSEQKELKRKSDVRRWEERRSFKTKKVDYTEMKTIRVDDRTMIVIPKSANTTEAIALYQANRMIVDRKKSWNENNK